MALVTINPGDTIVVGGVTYNIQEIGALQDGPNAETDRRFGAKVLPLHLRTPGAGPANSDYKQASLGNTGGKVGNLT